MIHFCCQKFLGNLTHKVSEWTLVDGLRKIVQISSCRSGGDETLKKKKSYFSVCTSLIYFLASSPCVLFPPTWDVRRLYWPGQPHMYSMKMPFFVVVGRCCYHHAQCPNPRDQSAVFSCPNWDPSLYPLLCFKNCLVNVFAEAMLLIKSSLFHFTHPSRLLQTAQLRVSSPSW